MLLQCPSWFVVRCCNVYQLQELLVLATFSAITFLHKVEQGKVIKRNRLFLSGILGFLCCIIGWLLQFFQLSSDGFVLYFFKQQMCGPIVCPAARCVPPAAKAFQLGSWSI